ncbi:hypothetical protein [Labrys sp. WJW]|uniref:hypothetical protein n=1 Tax=Labrys sp. WJW TaxID=1737983 RepID=UPI0012E9A184|nr:hypothetical protein [Labrys sp. WJW]
MKIVAHCAKCDRPIEKFHVTYYPHHYRNRRYWMVEANCHGEWDVGTIFERDLQNGIPDPLVVSLFGEKPPLDLTDEDIPF